MGGKPTLLVAGNLAGAAGRENPGAVPIDHIVGWLKARMPEFGGGPPKGAGDRALIVRSETGSGKSTVLPAHVFRLLRSERTAGRVRLAGAGVVCTQPRVLTAQTLARDLAADSANYPDLVMGVTVGYQTGAADEKPPRGLVYATAGSLLAQLRVLPDADVFARYRFIIVDEAHERSLDIDTLLMRLKGLLRRNEGNPRLPFVILASATLPVEKYARYFGLGAGNVVEVTGRAFEVRPFFPRVGTNDYPREAARVALEIHERNAGDPPEAADVLIFMPGDREIKATVEHLTKANWKFRGGGEGPPPFLLLVITGAVVQGQGRDYRLLKAPPGALRVPAADGRALLRPSRRVIVSTVVAETGLTIETLKYVVDCGWNRAQEVYFPGAFRGIVTRPAPRSRVRQRMGRAGRLRPGEFYPLYTRGVFEALPLEQPPDVFSEGVGPIFLDVVAATVAAAAPGGGGGPGGGGAPGAAPGGVFRVADVDMLDPPPAAALADALEKAVAFGFLRATPRALAEGGHELTRLGALAARFSSLGMAQVQTLLAGFLWRVSLRDLALVVALFDVQEAPLHLVPPPGAAQKEDGERARRRALRAGLPPFLLGPPAPAAGGGEGPPAGREEEDYYRARALLADDFLEALLTFEGFVGALSRFEGDLEGLLAWCAGNGVDFQKAAALAQVREGVLADAIAAGVNPFWGEEFRLAGAPPAEFLDVAARLKRCIHAGLRFSTLERAGEGYRAPTGDPVEVPPFFGEGARAHLRALGAGALADFRPRRLATNAVRLRGAKRSGADKVPPFLYRLAPGLLSVLDGFVPDDPPLGAPRPPPPPLPGGGV